MTLIEFRRSRFKPTPGKTYRNQGGGTYQCLYVSTDDEAVMQNTVSGWTCYCHGIGIYPDKSIDWDFSTGGHYRRVE